MAKKSLFSIPIFGWAIGRAGFIPIDRKNRRTAVKSFDLAVERIRKGNTIVIFPEEGRSRELAMRPFQRGAFLLAHPFGAADPAAGHRRHVRGLPRRRETDHAGRGDDPRRHADRNRRPEAVRAKDTLLEQSRGQIEAMLSPHQ